MARAKVNTTHYPGPLPTRGLRLEWWEVDGFAPLYHPREPVLLTKVPPLAKPLHTYLRAMHTT